MKSPLYFLKLNIPCMTKEEKKKFRASKIWKEFAKKIRELHNYKCDCCGVEKKKGLIVHHANEPYYDNLVPEDFFTLCYECHQTVSRLQHIKPENRYKYNSLWVDFYSRFLK